MIPFRRNGKRSPDAAGGIGGALSTTPSLSPTRRFGRNSNANAIPAPLGGDRGGGSIDGRGG